MIFTRRPLSFLMMIRSSEFGSTTVSTLLPSLETS
jgi:hypothetical protein